MADGRIWTWLQQRKVSLMMIQKQPARCNAGRNVHQGNRDDDGDGDDEGNKGRRGRRLPRCAAGQRMPRRREAYTACGSAQRPCCRCAASWWLAGLQQAACSPWLPTMQVAAEAKPRRHQRVPDVARWGSRALKVMAQLRRLNVTQCCRQKESKGAVRKQGKSNDLHSRFWKA